MKFFLANLLTLAGLSSFSPGAIAQSQCYGTVSNGRIEGAVELPSDGKNFRAYSQIARGAGRTFVHSSVWAIVTEAYAEMEIASPGTRFVYGETGWKAGGRFRPHRTHQNGLSVDFFVPILDERGMSADFPNSISNRFGYDIEFDSKGVFERYRIDFEAIADHLYALHGAALRKKAGISLVIIDPDFLPHLFKTRRGEYLRKHLPFMKGKPWVRHDEHFHVDFSISCKP